jgi:DNA-binding MarR family transcriptional regulator
MPGMLLTDFADKMNEIMPTLIKEFARRQTNELYKGKITLPQFLIMEFLDRQGEGKMTDLARFMRVTTAAMTGIIDRLVKYGYVSRIPDLKDRRIIKVRLTVKGLELVKKVRRERRQMFLDIFGRISEEDRENYLRILMQIREILSKEKEA